MNFGIILAGGTGTRMGLKNLPKQYVEVNGKPVLVYTMEKFQSCEDIHRIIVVADIVWHTPICSWCEQYGITKFSGFAVPGETRQQSVFNGLLACEEQQVSPDDIAAIHDAARPMVSPALISAGIAAAKECGGALAAITAKDTIYCCEDGRFVTGLLERSALCCGQTPETYNLDVCLELNRKATPEDLEKFHGCSELAFKYGQTVRVIPGEEMNFKLTTQEDLDRLYTVLGIPRKQHS
jgi:2-C-methyl-D-erythritol 4-phosphate cytidylyltransferase